MPTDTIWSIEVAGDLDKSDGRDKIQSHVVWLMILVEFLVHNCFIQIQIVLERVETALTFPKLNTFYLIIR